MGGVGWWVIADLSLEGERILRQSIIQRAPWGRISDTGPPRHQCPGGPGRRSEATPGTAGVLAGPLSSFFKKEVPRTAGTHTSGLRSKEGQRERPRSRSLWYAVCQATSAPS